MNKENMKAFVAVKIPVQGIKSLSYQWGSTHLTLPIHIYREIGMSDGLILNTACIFSVEGSCSLNVLTSGVSFAYGKLASDLAKYDVS